MFKAQVRKMESIQINKNHWFGFHFINANVNVRRVRKSV